MATKLEKKPATSSTGTASRVDQYVGKQLKKTTQQVRTSDIVTGVIAVVSFVVAFFLIASVIDAWILAFSPTFRVVLLGAFLIGMAAIAWVFVLPFFFKRINPQYAAKVIEEAKPEFKNSILNYLMLKNDNKSVHKAVLNEVSRKAATDLTKITPDSAVDKSNLIRAGFMLVGLAAIAVAYSIFSPKSPLPTILRILSPGSKISKPAAVSIIDVEPGDTSVFFGERLNVSAKVTGIDPDLEEVRLIFSTKDSQTVDAEVVMKSEGPGGIYSAKLATGSAGIQQPLYYRIEAGDGESPTFSVNVRPNPTITVEQIKITPPKYTQLDERTIEGSGDIQAVEGSKVEITAKSNLPIELAYIVPLVAQDTSANDSNYREMRTIKMKSEKNQAVGRIVAALNSNRDRPQFTHYKINFRSTDDFRNERPNIYPIRVLADLAPEIQVVEPAEQEVSIPVNQPLSVQVWAADLDYEISSVDVQIDHNGSKIFEQNLYKQEKQRQRPGERITSRFNVTPEELHLKPGDKAILFATAADNRVSATSQLPDPNITRTENYTLIISDPIENPDQPKQQEDENQQQKPSDETSQDQPSEKQDGEGSDGDGGDSGEGGESGSSGSEGTGVDEDDNDGEDQNGDGGSEGTGTEHGSQQNSDQQEQENQPGNENQNQPGSQSSSSSQEDNQSDETGGQESSGQQSDPQSSEQQDNEAPESGSDQSSGNQDPPDSASDQSAGSKQQSQSDESSRDAREKSGGKNSQSQDGSESSSGNQSSGQEGSLQDSNDQQEADGSSNSDSGAQRDSSGGQKGRQSNGSTGDDGGKSENQEYLDENLTDGETDPLHENASEGEQFERLQKYTGDKAEKNGSKVKRQSKSPDQKPNSENQKNGSQQQSSDSRESGHNNDQKQNDSSDESKGQESESSDPSDPSNNAASSKSKDPKQSTSDSEKKNGKPSQDSDSNDRQDSKESSQSNSEDSEGTSPNENKSQSDTEKKSDSQPKSAGEPSEEAPTGQESSQNPGETNEQESGSSEGKPSQSDSQSKSDSNSSGQNRGDQNSDSSQSKSESKGNSDQQEAGNQSGTGGSDGSQKSAKEEELPPSPDKANLDYTKKVTDLVLDELENQKYDPDPELLRQMNWTQQDLDNFLKRWQAMKKQAESGDLKAIRKYEEAQRSLGLSPKSKIRKAKVKKEKEFTLNEDGAVDQIPPHLRNNFNSYLKRRNRSKRN